MDSALPLLVVDDARFSRAIITKSLKGAGFRDVRFAASGPEALSQLEERPADIVISDWIMPGMDGLELTRKVREMDDILDHFTYVMLMSGEAESAIVTQAFEEGVDDFVHWSEEGPEDGADGDADNDPQDQARPEVWLAQDHGPGIGAGERIS